MEYLRHAGIDVGSTTVKAVVMDEKGQYYFDIQASFSDVKAQPWNYLSL